MRTPEKTEAKALVMIARGDKYTEISKELGIAMPTITKIKKRNEGKLDEIKDMLIEEQKDKATRILDKTHRELETRIDDRPHLFTTPELISLAKEMYSEAQGTLGAKNDPSTPYHARQDLKQVVQALESGDHIELQRVIFSKQNDKAD